MEIDSVRDIGRLIRSQRRRFGWSQTRLADQVATTRRWVSEIEQGKATAEVGLVLATLLTLGIRIHLELPARTGDEPGPGRGPEERVSADEISEVLSRHVEAAAPRTHPVTFVRSKR